MQLIAAEIQVLDDHGQWRDDLVSGYTEDNRFASVADAEAAMKDLIAAGSDVETLLGWRVEEVREPELGGCPWCGRDCPDAGKPEGCWYQGCPDFPHGE